MTYVFDLFPGSCPSTAKCARGVSFGPALRLPFLPLRPINSNSCLPTRWPFPTVSALLSLPWERYLWSAELDIQCIRIVAPARSSWLLSWPFFNFCDVPRLNFPPLRHAKARCINFFELLEEYQCRYHFACCLNVERSTMLEYWWHEEFFENP